MLFKVSVVIAVATLAGAVNADDELFCNGSVDPAGCKDLGDLCGNPLIAGNKFFLFFFFSFRPHCAETYLKCITL